MNKRNILKTILQVFEFLIPIVVLFSLAGLSIDTVKYVGSVRKHFLINPPVLFVISAFLSYATGIIDVPRNYWWKRSPWKILQLQSKVLLPLFGLSYAVLLALENFHYSNYVFSKYHLNLRPLLNICWVELFLLLLPVIVRMGRSYLKKTSVQFRLLIKLKKEFIVVRLLEFFTPVIVLTSLTGLLMDTLKYVGFVQKHYFINPFALFGISILLNYLLVVIDISKNHWWSKPPWKTLQMQSKIMLPFFVIWYIIFLALEDFNYPNYVFSRYHLNLLPIFNLILLEFFILLLPRLALAAEKYLKRISIQLSLRRKVIGVWLIVLFFICLIVRAYFIQLPPQ